MQLNLSIRALDIKGKKVKDPVATPDKVVRCWLESNDFTNVKEVLQLVGILQTNFKIVNLLKTEIEAINAIINNKEVGEFFDQTIIFAGFFAKCEKIAQGINPNEV